VRWGPRRVGLVNLERAIEVIVPRSGIGHASSQRWKKFAMTHDL
jgi:hypothetical protein